MDVAGIVQQLNSLAKEPKNRHTIVKDQGCVHMGRNRLKFTSLGLIATKQKLYIFISSTHCCAAADASPA